MRYLISNGSIIDPTQRVATIGHVLIENGKVTNIIQMTDRLPSGMGDNLEVIDARGCCVAPGFTDLHVHLREPGEEHKETIESGIAAAIRGGFTTICAMPNTQPPYDTPTVVRQVRQRAQEIGGTQVDVIGALTVDRAGTTLTEMAALVEAGCIAFSDDGSPLQDPAMMRNAMAYARMLDVPIMSHCEETRLNHGWAMHEGVISTRLGLAGYPAAAEEVQIARDIILAEQIGAHLHICHVSTAGGVELIRRAKQRGVHVTAEVTPHHLTMTDRWVLGRLGQPIDPPNGTFSERVQRRSREEQLPLPSWLDPRLLDPYDTNTRVSPPLRTEADIEALLEGLSDNTIDAIATDHAPHSIIDKSHEYALAACGISGLETALGLVLTLVHRGAVDLMNVVAKLTEGPATILKRAPTSLRPGSNANVVIFDPDRHWVVDTSQLVSKGKNSPLHGQRLKGQVMLTMINGTIHFRREGFGNANLHITVPSVSRLGGILPGDDEDVQ
ncbi:MAG: dihydroorotase [Blastochloris sp.]|nr:dihydroorotase [Blastochloris sp.]